MEEFIQAARIGKIRHPERIRTADSPQRYGSGVISQFSKTPSNIVCGRFWELRWAFGCPFNCAYCYLRGTSRGNMRPRYVKLETVLATLEKVFGDPSFNNGQPALFNSGELCDSLMNPKHTAAIADEFEQQDKHRLVLVSKSGLQNAAFLVEKPRRNTIGIWSINADEIARRWETAAPPPDERIRAAMKVADAGYDVRVRIDPIFPVESWQESYSDLVHKIFAAFTPRRIILGTPRGLWKTFHYAEKAGVDMSWSRYFAAEETGWGKKLPLEQRLSIYRFLLKEITAQGFSESNISICKETQEIYTLMKRPFEPFTCQCYCQ